MKFIDLLNEKWLATLDKIDKNLDVYKNPSTSEAMKILNNSKYKEIRGIIDGKNIYIWDSYLGIHQEISSGIKLKPNTNMIRITFYKETKEIYMEGFEDRRIVYPDKVVKYIYKRLHKMFSPLGKITIRTVRGMEKI